MTITPERLFNASAASWIAESVGESARERWSNAVRIALEADDLYRSTTSTPPPETEPELHSHINLGDDGIYRHVDHTGWQYLLPTEFDASDLRAIADHMDWKHRSEQKTPVQSTDPYRAALNSLSADDFIFSKRIAIARAIAAALEAHRKEAK